MSGQRDEFDDVLQQMRTSAIATAEHERNRASSGVRLSGTPSRGMSLWPRAGGVVAAAACLAVCLTGGVAVQQHHRHEVLAEQQRAATVAAQNAELEASAKLSDDALMQAVSGDVTTSVPRALQPLTVQESSSGKTTTTSRE